MSKQKIAVIGDVMVDLRRWGPSSRTSPEDTNCRIIDICGQMWELGGAANVARWLAEGQNEYEVHLIGQYVFDDTGRMLERLCQDSGIHLSKEWMRWAGDYRTTLKERICVIDPEAARIRQFVRCDQDTNMVLSAHDIEGLLHSLVEDDPYDFYVVADYNKGIFNSPYAPKLMNWLGHFGCRHHLVVNSKCPSRWASIVMSALICNEKEVADLKTEGGRSDNHLHGAVEADRLVVTMSSNGVRLIHDPEGDFEVVRAESKAEQVLDVTGAGDAFMAGFAYEMFRKNPDVKDWLDRGSAWAAQCCAQIGCGRPVHHREKEGPNGTEQLARLPAGRVAAS